LTSFPATGDKPGPEQDAGSGAGRFLRQENGPENPGFSALRTDEGPRMIGLEHYLTVAAVLFVIGIFGLFLNRKNVIILLMSIELMLLAVNINLVAFSAHLGDLVGQVFTLFVLTVAAAEAAIGLAILVCFFRNRGTIAVEDINVMKG
jgi:NADH-quinone oxidoreductase subunit K